MSPVPYPPDLRAAAVADYQAGMTLDEIATKHGIGASTIANWVKKAGGDMRTRVRRQPTPTCTIDDCDGPHLARGYCRTHYNRIVRGYEPRGTWQPFNIEDRLEDCRWMADSGEHLTGAARRLGITRNGLDTWLRKYDPETLRVLSAREAWPEESRASFHGARQRVTA